MPDKSTPPSDAMTDLKTLRQLVKLMADNDLTELDLKDHDSEVHLKRGATSPPVVAAAAPPLAAPPPAAPAAPTQAPVAPADDPRVTIDSPMVGTFYAAPNPDAAPFVAVGDSVGAETVVCLIEAMKVFNEIKAEQAGTVAKLLVESGQAVEFGQPLFEITP